MGTFRFSMKMLIKDYKKSLFYGMTLIFAVTVNFIFFNIINNEEIADTMIATSGMTWSDVNMPFSSIISFIIVCFCCFMIFFANNFFLSRKTTELAVIAMSGSGYIHSTMYVLYQTFVLLILATPLGIIIGKIAVPYVNAYMYDMLHVTKDIYLIPTEAYLYSFLIVAIVLAMICVLVAGYLHRNDILVLLSQEKTMQFHSGLRKIPSFVYLGLYVLGIVMMFMNAHQANAYVAPTLVGIAGAMGVIRFVLPDAVKKLKKTVLLTKRYALIAISNLNYSIQRSLLLIFLMTMLVTGMMTILAVYQNSPREYATSIIGYIVVIVLLTVSIIYKLSMEAMTRKTLFFNLWKIGYTRKELKKIIRQEIIWYCLILIVIPLVYILFIAGRFIYFGDMTVQFALVFSLAYMIPVMISGLIIYFQYVHIVIQSIKGGQ